MIREVARVVAAQDTSDGAGVRLRRALGTPALDHVDPFLLLDEFRSDQRDDYARCGPFVMNTREEILQAVRDLEAGTFLR